MNTSAKHLGGLALLAPMALSSVTAKQKQPNIIFFLVDDYGWADSQVQYGQDLYPRNNMFHTPNMLRLAQKGVVMTNAYACSLSTPTRTSLMSGLNSAHLRITTFTSPKKDTPTDASGGTIGVINENESDPLARGDWNWNGISTRPGVNNTMYITPFVQHLKNAGYFTIHVGKAHWGTYGTPGCSPYNMGFIVNVAGSCNGFPRSYLGKENYGNNSDMWTFNAVQSLAEYYGTDTHLTEALTLEAKKALEYPISKGQPFYLYMSHYGVHTPITRDDRFIQRYLDMGLDEGAARYSSMVEGVDKSLGDLMDFLDEKGIADNTIIIFMSDNGGHSANTVKGGTAHTQNAPLREGKASVYEGGIRVPEMFYWPGKTQAGQRIDTPTMPEDMYPTIMEMAGIKNYTTVQDMDGQSLVSLITKNTGVSPDRELVFHMPHQWRIEDQDDIDFMTAMRKGEWKLVYRMHTGALELYNIKNDLSEMHNVADQHPQLVKDMAKALGNRLRSWRANMPIVRATGKPVAMPDEL
ncbi:MAG: sulfatase [Bacteroidaceae bacterium]|nr:sulfatase [Bacteroidaceae bacterium]